MRPQGISWGTGVAVAIAVFLAGVATLVTIALRQDVSLVQDQYYDAGQRYDLRLQAMQRAQSLAVPLTIDVGAGELIIGYPRTGPPGSTMGTVTLYRPSSRALDRRVAVAPDTGWRQSLPIAPLQPGLWRVQVEWTTNGTEYYVEQPLVIQ